MRLEPTKLEDVARHAKVSKMTVSLCLRPDQGEGRMSALTRERVLGAVKELGYRPNVHARGLRLGRSNVVALYAGHGYLNVRRPYFTEVVSGLQEGCDATKMDLLLHGAFHTAMENELMPAMLNGRIDGLLVDMYPNDPLAARILRSDIAVIAISNEIEGLPSIIVDDISGGEMLAEHLYAKGHRRVAYLIGEVEPLSGRNRRMAFMRTCASLGVQAVLVQTHDQEDLGARYGDLIQLGVTALACWNDQFARETLSILLDMGVDVPGKMAVTGFDGCPVSVIEKYPLTTIVAPWSQVAKSAVLSLTAKLAGETVSPCVVYPVRFIQGATS